MQEGNSYSLVKQPQYHGWIGSALDALFRGQPTYLVSANESQKWWNYYLLTRDRKEYVRQTATILRRGFRGSPRIKSGDRQIGASYYYDNVKGTFSKLSAGLYYAIIIFRTTLTLSSAIRFILNRT